jgi:uncharacterized protein (TIGR00661 family)
MKILFGVQGTGNGHLTRAIALSEALKSYAVDVDFLISGRPEEPMPFSNLQWRDGLTFVATAGMIDLGKTFKANNILKLVKDIANLRVDDYDLIVSDFEPIVAWAAKTRGHQTIGISHQNAFRHVVPTCNGHLHTKLMMRYFAPADREIGLHWHHFDQPILPPIIDLDLNNRPVQQHNKVTVYVPAEDQKKIIRLLTKIPEFEFYIYSPVLTDNDDGHIHTRKTNRTTFQHDLMSSKGVICNSGFELISECLQLGIKVLTKPLAGQLEQLANAAAVSELGYGTVSQELFLPTVEKWLDCGKSVQVTYPKVHEHLAAWLASGANQPASELAEELWRKVCVRKL